MCSLKRAKGKERVCSVLIHQYNEMVDLHSEEGKALWNCSRPAKLCDLQADSRGGPNKESEPEAVELSLTQREKMDSC